MCVQEESAFETCTEDSPLRVFSSLLVSFLIVCVCAGRQLFERDSSLYDDVDVGMWRVFLTFFFYIMCVGLLAV